MATITHSFFQSPPTSYQDVFADLPCIANQTSSTLEKVGLGVATGILKLPFDILMSITVQKVLKACGILLTQPQEVAQQVSDVLDLPASPITTIIKIALVAETVIFAPLLEEFLFRGCLHSVFSWCFPDPNSTMSKVIRVVGNGLLFGAGHIVSSQGWTNVPIFLSTFFAGCIYTVLRERTGDITASTAAHMTHNGIITMVIFGLKA